MLKMRRFVLAGLLALPLLAFVQQTVQASGCCCSCCNFGTNITIQKWFRPGCGCGPCDCNCCGGGNGCGSPCGGCGTCNCGPWYLYWPMEAHFQAPAPTGYPYWPGPMAASGLPGYGGFAAAPAYPGYGYGPSPMFHAAGYAPPNAYAGYPNFAPGMMPQAPGMMQAPTFQPVGYTPQVGPSYWYDH
jgi:hypothetical protein